MRKLSLNIISGVLLGLGAILPVHSQDKFLPAETGYTELDDTKPRDSEEVWGKQKCSVQLAWGNTDTRYSKFHIPSPLTGRKWQGTAWKGERINAQAVLWTNKDLKNVNLEVSDLKNGLSVIPSSAIRSSFVRYVMTDELNKDRKGACGHRPDRTMWDSSLVADVLDARTRFEIERNSTRPVWLTIQVPADAKSGKYKGTLMVTAEEVPASAVASPKIELAIPFEFDVLSRTLPEPREWAFHLDLWQNPYSVARYYNVPLWSEAHFDAMRPLMKQLADAGQKVITATIMHKPWNGQTQDAFDSMVGKTKKLDGSWTYDYTVFDRWVEFMMSIGIDRQINCFTLIPWELKFDYYDQGTNRIQFVEAQPGDVAYEDYWLTFLKDFSHHLRAKGWFDRTTISMDERAPELMRHAFALIRKADPDFKISGQGNYHAEVEPQMYEYCLAYEQPIPSEVIETRRKAGKLTTVYTCCSEPYPNFFTFSTPAEAAWTIWYSIAQGYDGYLRWAYNSWTTDPLRDSRFRTWAAGDCFLVYPGYSSIRMERLVEGVQDAEKLRILRQEFETKGKKASLKKQNEALSLFQAKNLTETNAATMVNAARKIINGL